MGFCEKLLHIIVAGVLIMLAMVAAATAATMAKPGCPNRCGDVEIPYPYGLTKGCYLNKTFKITCNDSEIPKIGRVVVTEISIKTHELHVLNNVAQECYNSLGQLLRNKGPLFWAGRFTISNSKNKFIALGCDTIAYLRGSQNNDTYWTGCASLCTSLRNVVNGSCSGVGCCEVGFPDGLKDIKLEVNSFYQHVNVSDFNPCGYAFVVADGKFNFSADYLLDLPNDKLPVVLDWTVGNLTCEVARKEPEFACKKNSECLNPQNRQGYRCQCKQGYQGNPYLDDAHGGCKDIDECIDPTLNNCKTKSCFNIEGNYTCSCPKGYHGDGRKDGQDCAADPAPVAKIPIVIGVSFVAVLVGSSWLYIVYKKRKLMKLRESFFRKNGGLILKQKLIKQQGSKETAKIFTVEELKKATNNYAESRIIGEGGFGTVYKGFLPDKRIVAIKKSKTVNQNQIDQFVNEVVLLSQIDHRNIVKLLGCCLETQVPLLVYEFVPKGTLFNYINHESSASTIQWETRLRIAAETANALSYLHFADSTPIIHRDVKSSNILLDDDFTAKVSDFGISRLVPRDQKELATAVQGTLGYLDPEYLQTNQLTEKSDVYSFGVVLVELLTGEDVLSFNRSEKDRSLAMYFLSSLKDDRLFEILENRIVEGGNKEQINEVVKLAKRCLSVKGDERPTMKELATELEGIRKTETHSWVNAQSNLEEAEHLLGETSHAYDYSERSSSIVGYDSINDQVTLAWGDGR
ncbi:wall-associated receptor kinase 2-like [Corylus avellana]|uniref:wall-associated receptor kinase 2-like n=1 Tax=Corylus avellana TaxID=13451 RepID=UPI00286A0B19|nr:wall-associated receptor kinase 2-like [Corylus avellana]